MSGFVPTGGDTTGRPLVTYYDDATGERTELSGATLQNWVSKTANLLVDGHGLGPGDTAAVLLPPHWQTAAVLLGCWSAGLTVTDEGDGADIVFAAVDRLDSVRGVGDVYALGLAPFAVPMRPGPPPGVLDYAVEVRAYGDYFSGTREIDARAVDRAAALGIASGDRVLIDVDRVTDPLDWLLAPLAAGASTVLCRHLDASALPARLAAERATVLTP